MRSAYPPYKTRSVVGWIRRAARYRGPGTAVGRAASTIGRAMSPKFGIAGCHVGRIPQGRACAMMKARPARPDRAAGRDKGA